MDEGWVQRGPGMAQPGLKCACHEQTRLPLFSLIFSSQYPSHHSPSLSSVLCSRPLPLVPFLAPASVGALVHAAVDGCLMRLAALSPIDRVVERKADATLHLRLRQQARSSNWH